MRSAGICVGTLVLFLMGGLAAGEVSVPVSVSEPAGVARQAFPASGGIPFKPATVKDVSELMLVDASGKPVPAQFSRLASYDDGSVQWALVDLLADLPASGRADFTVKSGAAATPAMPLKITETEDQVTFDTGTIQFTVSKANFSLFDAVTVGGKKVVTGTTVDLLNCELAPQTMTPEGRPTTYPAMKKDGKVFPCKTGKPTRVKWEYKGPVRATLRVDGDYIGDGGPKLSYTTRITAWGGSSAVRVEHSIRNSNPEVGYDAYIKRAALTLKLGITAEPQTHEAPGLIVMGTPPPPPKVDTAPALTTSTRPTRKPAAGDYSAKPCDDWASGGDGALGLMVQDRHTGGVYRGPGTYLKKVMDGGWYQSWPGLFVQSVKGNEAVVEIVSKGPELTGKGTEQGALGFTQDGTFALADRSHKDSEVWFDFYTGSRDAAANKARADACRSKLLVVAPGEWYSETECLGSGHFGTLADEVATYKKWGWKGADDVKKHPTKPHQPFAFVPMEWMHDVSEDDAPEGYLLQFLRTGQRGFFDWGEAYVGFFRGHAIFRTDWGEDWGVPAVAGRKTYGLGFGWYGPHYYDWCDSRMHGCHHYGRGILDYYCLTGNTDALEAGLDVTAEMSGGYDRSKPGQGFGFSRSFGRAFNNVLRAYQLTRDPKWRKIADHYADLILKASNYDAQNQVYLQSMGSYTFYFTREWAIEIPNKPYSVPQRMKDYMAKNNIKVEIVRGNPFAVQGDQKWEIFIITQIFELSECHLAMDRYARLTNSEPMKQRLVDVTRGIIKYFWVEKCQFMQDRVFLNWPEKGKPLNPWAFFPDHDKCPVDPCGTHSGYSTRYIADMCARAYGWSGDKYFLDWSKKCWDRGSKRMYQQMSQTAGPDEAGAFASITGAHADTLLECAARLTYEWPRAK